MNYQIAEKLFNLALDVVPVANAKIVSAVVYKNRIYGLGHNSYKTHPKAKEFHNQLNKECLHAEMMACFYARYNLGEENLKKATIYVVRAKKDGSLGLAKPCQACDSMIRDLGIKKIIYSKDNENFVEE